MYLALIVIIILYLTNRINRRKAMRATILIFIGTLILYVVAHSPYNLRPAPKPSPATATDTTLPPQPELMHEITDSLNNTPN